MRARLGSPASGLLPRSFAEEHGFRAAAEVDGFDAGDGEVRALRGEQGAEGVEVVVAEEEVTAGGAGAFGGEPKCARVAEMEMARGRRGEAAEVGGRIFNHG